MKPTRGDDPRGHVSPGVSQKRIAELKRMSWRKLVAHCESILERRKRSSTESEETP